MSIPATVSFRANNSLQALFGRLSTAANIAAEEASEDAAREVMREARSKTPIGEGKSGVGVFSGRAIDAWVIRRGSRGGWAVINVRRYASVLEFGGYPVRRLGKGGSGVGFVRGRARLGGLPPGPRTRRPRQVAGLSENAQPFGQPFNANVSKQAPSGMLRISMKKIDERRFAFLLEKSLRRQVARVGGRLL